MKSIAFISLILLPLLGYSQEGTMTIKQKSGIAAELVGVWTLHYPDRVSKARDYWFFDSDGKWTHFDNLNHPSRNDSINSEYSNLTKIWSGFWYCSNDTLLMEVNWFHGIAGLPYNRNFKVIKEKKNLVLYYIGKSISTKKAYELIPTDLGAITTVK